LDEMYVYNKVKTQTNILSEILMLKKALRQYSVHIGNHEPEQKLDVPIFNSHVKEIDPLKNCKSKFFYNQIIRHKLCTSPVQIVWTTKFGVDEDVVKTSYRNKIMRIKDKKLSEFNFKVLSNILPCNYNLVKWRKRESGLCSICDVEETIEHLLYSCDFAKGIWIDFMRKSNLDIGYEDVVLGISHSIKINWIISLIAYSIFVMWTRENIHNVYRHKSTNLHTIRQYMSYRISLYKHIGWDIDTDYLF
ncbi:MAG: hypothetical protein GY697_15460, partial [Desulfobacterales bacterium]|nr:hypothetical protein [Desulfobacterales bacterium]